MKQTAKTETGSRVFTVDFREILNTRKKESEKYLAGLKQRLVPTKELEDGDHISCNGSTLALIKMAEDQIKDIDEAIERQKRGTFGICIVCGKPIPEPTLLKIPWAKRDDDCHKKKR